MTLYWNTITSREIDILYDEETDAAVRRHLFMPAMAFRPEDHEALLQWISSRARLARRWNERQDAAFAQAERTLARLIAERDAEDERRIGAKLWPTEPFEDIRWRQVDPRGGSVGATVGRLLEVAWHDARGQLRIALVEVQYGRSSRPGLISVGGDDLGRDFTRVTALLMYDLAVESTGQTTMRDPDAT